jgi:hypothetical protein
MSAQSTGTPVMEHRRATLCVAHTHFVCVCSFVVVSEHAARVERHRQEKSNEHALLLKKAATLKRLYAEQATAEIKEMVQLRDEAREKAARNKQLPSISEAK